jgi:hypothetical protein
VAHPLDGCLAKFKRGEQQLHALKDEINAFRTSGVVRLMPDSDRQRRPIIRAVDVREPPASLAIAIGECANSFRSGLDYLAYQLALQHTGDPLPDKVARATAFPIFPTGPKYRTDSRRQLQGISPEARRAIERLQPYHRKLLPTAIALQWLNEICNVDKHRALHPTGSMLAESQFGVGAHGGSFELERIEVFARPLFEGAIVARFVGQFSGRIQFTQGAVFDVVFAPDCAAPSVREESVLFTTVAVRDFIFAELMPALAVFFPDEYTFAVNRPA